MTLDYGKNHTVIGQIYSTIAYQENTLIDIARQYSLGFEEIIQANPDLDPWVPGEGSTVILPRQFILPKEDYQGIYINLAEMRIYYYQSERKQVITYPISIGRNEWRTPRSNAKVIEKLVNPAWYPPKSVRKEHADNNDPLPLVVPPGKDNPLGKYAIQLNLPGYFIHGTNRPEGIGMRVTHGCIRMRPEDIEPLFQIVARGTSVNIEFLPHKVGLSDGVIYFEAHQGGYGNKEQDYFAESLLKVGALAKKHNITVDWERMIRIAKRGRGIPTPLNIDQQLKIEPLPPQPIPATSTKTYIF